MKRKDAYVTNKMKSDCFHFQKNNIFDKTSSGITSKWMIFHEFWWFSCILMIFMTLYFDDFSCIFYEKIMKSNQNFWKNVIITEHSWGSLNSLLKNTTQNSKNWFFMILGPPKSRKSRSPTTHPTPCGPFAPSQEPFPPLGALGADATTFYLCEVTTFYLEGVRQKVYTLFPRACGDLAIAL